MSSLPVVYLAGSGHTGSTLLSILLSEHPGIASVGEIAIKPKILKKTGGERYRCSCGQLIASCGFWREVFQRLNAQGFPFGPGCWPNDYRSANPVVHRLLTKDSSYAAVRALQQWSARHLPIYSTRVARTDRVNVAFVRAVLDVKRASVFLDTTKSVSRLLHLLRIPEIDIKVVALVRDVRGLAASAKRRGYSIRHAAEHWKRDQLVIQEVTDAYGRPRLLVRYEDLCRCPAETLSSLWNFCDVEPIPFVATPRPVEHHVLGNSMRLAARGDIRLDERWRTELDEREATQALRIAGDLHRQLGYA
jgi:hypothetical protein